MRVPPGVSPRDFDDALKKFEEALGKEWVFTSDEDINTYRDSYSPFWHETEEPIPSAAVAPESVEQVQQIVRIAGAHKIPLWTISTGKNLGYGGSAPLLGGSVVLDLKRMDRVIEVNDKNHYALVEPGVSYFDLYHYIHDRGLKVWIDPPDPGWGSLVGNALERGGGYTPMRDHFDCHCGMEVVLANGEFVRTGMGALPNSKTWQQYKYGFGPYVDGIFSQSNLGVVTKMGFWLYPEPEAFLSGNVVVDKHDDLFALVEIFANLMNSGIVQATTTVISPLAYGPDPELAALRASGSTKDLEDYAARKKIGYWSVSLPFYGPADVVTAQWEYAKRKFSVIPGVRFEDRASYRFPAGRRPIGEDRESCSFWRAQLADIFDWRPAQPGPHVVFADHSDDGRGRSRSAESFRSSCQRFKSQWGQRGRISCLELFRACLRHHLFLPHRARRGKEPQESRSF